MLVGTPDIDPNVEAAVVLYRRAAEQGSGRAAARIAMLTAIGVGGAHIGRMRSIGWRGPRSWATQTHNGRWGCWRRDRVRWRGKARGTCGFGCAMKLKSVTCLRRHA
ncbi:MAG: hypothetical protein M0D54_10930 [Hyphomonadaceae bacterium JAD_PAG50586_4]|nr:MAG: hypothetical protein M0D54_10930 [Hyphomonadaceae bacterium JAD_PAG50586_4]